MDEIVFFEPFWQYIFKGFSMVAKARVISAGCLGQPCKVYLTVNYVHLENISPTRKSPAKIKHSLQTFVPWKKEGRNATCDILVTLLNAFSKVPDKTMKVRY